MFICAVSRLLGYYSSLLTKCQPFFSKKSAFFDEFFCFSAGGSPRVWEWVGTSRSVRVRGSIRPVMCVCGWNNRKEPRDSVRLMSINPRKRKICDTGASSIRTSPAISPIRVSFDMKIPPSDLLQDIRKRPLRNRNGLFRGADNRT